MSLIAKIAEIVEVLNEVKELKVAQGFSEDASLADIITEIKTVAESLTAATGTAPAAQ